MLKKRIIPIVLLDGFSVMKTVNFDVRRNLGSPITVLQTYNTRNVDELIILDIDASRSNRSVDKFLIKEITEDCFMPLTIGGGVQSCQHIEDLLQSGADKISINSYSYSHPTFIKEAVQVFGSQCIVTSIDIISVENKYLLYVDGRPIHDINYLDWISKLQDLGAGEILVNDVTRDGTMIGSDKVLAKSISCKISVPVIFSGGIDSPNDAADLIEASNVDAVGISSIFHFTNYTPSDCRDAIKHRGFPTR